MRNVVLMWLTQWLRVRVIEVSGRPYLERYWVGRVLGVTVYLHRFLTSDGERHLHDHPWPWSVGIPLTGGYDEERLHGMDPHRGMLLGMERRRPWRWTRLGALDFHRIATVRPRTWTLFIHGPRTKRWGFLEEGEPPRWSVVPTAPTVHLRYSQPLDVVATLDWHRHAPTGREHRAAIEQEAA